jgi:hypothetical protein
MFNLNPNDRSAELFQEINNNELARKGSPYYQRKMYQQLQDLVNNIIPDNEFDIYHPDVIDLNEPTENFNINDISLMLSEYDEDISPIVIKISDDEKLRQQLILRLQTNKIQDVKQDVKQDLDENSNICNEQNLPDILKIFESLESRNTKSIKNNDRLYY